MKKNLLIAIAAIMLLVLTNPSLTAHKEALTEKAEEEYTAILRKEGKPVDAELIPYVVREGVNKATFRKNFYLFSLTYFRYVDGGGVAWEGGEFAGVGILGQVFILTTMFSER